MKATIINIESENLRGFCYNHGGIRISDNWFDKNGKTTRFLTSDKKHPSYEYYSYVYICNELGPMNFMNIISGSRSCNVATCKDEDGDNCYIYCKNPKVGDVLEFNKIGFHPYVSNPEPNYYGRERDDY
jgi:hypothetical protein